MTSNRLLRIISARWWLFAIIIIGTVVLAANLVGARNRAILPSEATVGITFNRLVDEVDDTLLQERLDLAGQVAVDVNKSFVETGIDPLTPTARAEISEDPQSGRLLFIGRGSTEADAAEVAIAMRSRFLAAQALDDSESIDGRIAVVAAELDTVIEEIAVRTELPPVSEAELARRVQITQLRSELAALTDRYGALTIELITPSDPPRSALQIESDRAAVQQQIAAVQLALLTAESTEITLPPEDSELLLLRSQEMQLRAALDALVAQRIQTQSIGTLDPVEYEASDVQAIRSVPVVVLGLLLGLFVAAAGLIMVDRTRRPVWEATDLPPQDRLPEIAKRPRPYGDQSQRPWYPSAPQGRRKSGIQSLRSAVEGLPSFGSGLTIGVASLTSQSTDAHALAADLASSIAGSGTTALLLDTDYASPTDLVEYRHSGCEMSAAMADPSATLAEAGDRGGAGLATGVSIDTTTAESPDILAQPSFARLVQTATNMYGAVIVACPPSTTPGYHILTQRLDAMILVAPIGHPLPNEIESAIHTLDDRRATALGVVLLTRAENPISTAFGRLRNTIAESSSEPSTQPETGHEANVPPQPTDGAPESTRQGSTETGPQGRGPSRQITDRVTIVSVEGPLPDGAQPGNPKIEIDDVAPADGAKAAGSTTRSRKTTTKSAASAKPSTDAAATGKDAPEIDASDSSSGPKETAKASTTRARSRKTKAKTPDDSTDGKASAASTSASRTRKKRATKSDKAETAKTEQALGAE